MKMHMIGAMYGVTDKIMISAMGGLTMGTMYHSLASGGISNDYAYGMTDTNVTGSYILKNDDTGRFKLDLGVSIPTGSVTMNGSDGSRLSYAMQTGSGSYEFLPGFAYVRDNNGYSLGLQANASIKLNSNSNNFRYGNNFNANMWVSKRMTQIFALSARLNYMVSGGISGMDFGHLMLDCPCDIASFSGGQRSMLFVGTNIFVVKGLKISVEAGAPIYQDVNGIQPKTSYIFMLGLQKAL